MRLRGELGREQWEEEGEPPTMLREIQRKMDGISSATSPQLQSFASNNASSAVLWALELPWHFLNKFKRQDSFFVEDLRYSSQFTFMKPTGNSSLAGTEGVLDDDDDELDDDFDDTYAGECKVAEAALW